MNVMCLVIDRLHAGYLGAYGNTWVETPSLDRLAAEAFLFDQYLIDTPDLDRTYRSYWQGRHALLRDDGTEDRRPSLPGLLRDSGLATTLLTDEPSVANHELALEFDDLVQLAPPRAVELADSMEQTHLAEFFARTVGWLESADAPFFLWCHAQGLGGVWDAPLEFGARYADVDDPDPRTSATVPCQMLEDDYDPDELLVISQAYAGQISLLDECIGGLLEFLDAKSVVDETLLVLLSSRGFPLGEHRCVGPCGEGLNAELVHVPLMIRFPDRLGAAARSQSLTHPADVWASLLDFAGATDVAMPPGARSVIPTVRGEDTPFRDRLAVLGENGRRAIRTPAWYLNDGPDPGLYGKPDDRWEVNNVADRYPELVDSMRGALDEFERSLTSPEASEIPPLDDVLLSGLD